MNELRKTQRLRGKNVVVIGGSRGLGKTIVATTHTEGARVLAVFRHLGLSFCHRSTDPIDTNTPFAKNSGR